MRVLSILLVLTCGCDGSIVAGTIPTAVVPAPTVKTPAPGPARLDCSTSKHAATTTLHRLTTAQYQHAINDIFDARVRPSTSWPAPSGTTVTGFSTEEQVNQVGEQGATQLIRAADDVALGVGGAIGELLPCSRGASPGQACFDSFLGSFARRAFRRSLTTDERATLQAIYQGAMSEDASFGDAVAIVTAAILQSPQFVYVVEDAGGSGRALTGQELASRLSFYFWDSVPDDELLAVAESGTLTDPTVLAAQARRLLESPKADTAIARYFREWTQAKELLATDKDSTRFPMFDLAYARSLGGSFDRFVVAQVRSQATLETLLTSTDTYVDEHLAPTYGVTPPAPGSWLKVAGDRSRVAGLLTHPLLMATNAHTTEPSFVFRGRMVAQRLLCSDFGTPPANALSVLENAPRPENPTARQVATTIESNATCGGCHRVLDPPGLALERYDAIGQYRETDELGRPIDTRGALIGLGDDPVPFEGPSDLAATMARRPEATECLSKQLFRFAFSRRETEADACALQQLGDVLSESRGDVSAAMLALTSTDAFTWRTDP